MVLAFRVSLQTLDGFGEEQLSVWDHGVVLYECKSSHFFFHLFVIFKWYNYTDLPYSNKKLCWKISILGLFEKNWE